MVDDLISFSKQLSHPRHFLKEIASVLIELLNLALDHAIDLLVDAGLKTCQFRCDNLDLVTGSQLSFQKLSLVIETTVYLFQGLRVRVDKCFQVG